MSVLGVPWLRSLPPSWSTTQIRRVAEIRNGADYKAVEVATGGYPVYGSGGEFRRASEYLFDGESVLFGRKGTVDRPMHVTGKFWTVDTMFYTCVDESRMLPRFLFYYATTMPFGMYSTTTALPSMTQAQLGSHVMPFPPLDEQRAIADYLDRETARIDTLIEEQQRLIELLRERRGAVADQLLNPSSCARPLKLFVADVTVGIVVNPSAWYDQEGILALRGLNVRDGYVAFDDLVYLTPEGDKRHSKSRLRAGDVVMVRTGQAGAAAVIPPELDGANAIDLLIVRTGPDVDPEFLAAYFNAPSTRSRITHGSVGAIQGHFNVRALRELEFPAISVSEQHHLAQQWLRRTTAIDTLIAETERFIELARERRSVLITAAVTGQVDVRGCAA